MILATGRDFWPLFLHVFGAMVLWGAVLTAFMLALASERKRIVKTLLAVAVPAYVLMRACAQWIYSSEGFSGKNDPTWVGIGFMAADIGLLLLLITLGLAFWWGRSGNPVLGRIVAGLSAVYLVLLTVAMLAMSGKWG